MFETIVALASAPIKSALAIIRLSGDNCFEVANKFFSKKINPEINKIYHGYIKDDEEIIDEVVLLAYKHPHSYTGEDSVEIMCHGSPIIFNQIIEVSLKCGARLATGGEFTSRAYLHNKMDLVQAESINDLINAETKESKKISLMSLNGETSKLISPLKESVASLLSLLEVNIDYPEYQDIEQLSYKKLTEEIQKNVDYVQGLIKNGEKGKIIRNGVNIALVGKPNVGKSSLLNALIGENKAIVTDIKGTTRDVVEGKFSLNGVLINLFDTAGIRESNDSIEKIGIKKSIDKIEEADLIIAIVDDLNFDEEDQKILDLIKDKKNILVHNKADLYTIKKDKELYISAINNEIEPLKKEILSFFNLTKENYDNPSISNVREIGILNSIENLLKEIIKDSNNNVPLDLISSKLQFAYTKILSLTGEDNDFDIAKEIFSRFCVGK